MMLTSFIWVVFNIIPCNPCVFFDCDGDAIHLADRAFLRADGWYIMLRTFRRPYHYCVEVLIALQVIIMRQIYRYLTLMPSIYLFILYHFQNSICVIIYQLIICSFTDIFFSLHSKPRQWKVTWTQCQVSLQSLQTREVLIWTTTTPTEQASVQGRWQIIIINGQHMTRYYIYFY